MQVDIIRDSQDIFEFQIRSWCTTQLVHTATKAKGQLLLYVRSSNNNNACTCINFAVVEVLMK